MSSAAALDLVRVRSGYGEALIVREVDLDIRRGEIFVLLGKNGMGKSTLLKTVMGFLPIQAGSVRLFGEDITGQAPHRLARKAIAYTPQEQALFQDLSVEDNLRLALRDDKLFEAGVERIGTIFSFIPQRLKQRAGTLSGGEQKMLLVARALMAKPRLMLIDEISEGLQPSVIERLAGVLRSERDSAQVSILLIEQNVKFALSVADRYAVLKLGEIVDRGSVADRGAEKSITDHLAV
jgi:branched-chain amino acid transport system ATP-binding protein